jgi:ADP-heptose:LPS heptosyltransferase
MPRPLVIRCGGFGEVVLLTALIEQLHARTGERIDVISSGSWAGPLLRGLGSVGEIRILASRNTPYWLDFRQQQLVRWLRSRGAGPTWCCDNHDAGRDLLRRAGIADDYVCDSRAFAFEMTEHFVDRWIRLANLTPPALQGKLPKIATCVPRAARLAITAEQATAHEQWLRRHGLREGGYFVIQAGNKRNTRAGLRSRRSNTKHWPEERWVQLMRGVRERYPDDAIVLLGVRNERGLNDDIARAAQIAGIHNLAGDLPVPVLLPLLRGARGMFSVDTGPAHAAAALGCPTVALFGEASPVLYRPGGVVTPAIALTGEMEGRPSIRGISVQAVIAAWDRLAASLDARDAPRAASASA